MDPDQKSGADRNEHHQLLVMFEHAPGFMALLTGPDHRFDFANPAYRRLVGGRDVVGKTVAEALPEVVEQGYIGLLDEVVRSREVFRSSGARLLLETGADQPPSERFVDFVYQPILGIDGEVTGIFVEGHDVTEAYVAREQLQATVERNRRIIEGVKDHSVFVTDVAGTIVDWTPGAAAIFGWPAEQIIGRNAELLFTPEDRAAGVPAKELRAAAENGCAADERWHVRQDGSRFFANGSVRPLHDAAGEISGFLKIARDETARRGTEAELRASEERYRSLFTSLDAGFCVVELRFDDAGNPADYLFVEVNSAFERQTGLVAAQGCLARDLIPDLEQQWFDRYGQVARTREPLRFEDGSTAMGRWFDVHAFPIDDPDDNRIAILFHDISVRRSAEQALRESEARLRALTDNLPAGMVYQIATGADGTERRFLFVSRSHERLTGVSAEAVLADPTIAYDLILPEYHEAMAAAEQRSIADRKPFDVEVRFRRTDGEVRWCRIISAPRQQDDGSLIWDGIQIDITDQKRGEGALRESESRFQAMANSIDQMVWSTRPDGFHDFYNQRWYDFTGVPRDSTDGEEWSGTFHPDDQERAWSLWRDSLRTGEPYHIEYRLRHRSGEYRWVLGRAQAVRDRSGAIERWFGTCTDIDEIVRARQVLARTGQELERQVAERTKERDQLWSLSEDLLARADYAGNLLAVNPAWTRVLGWSERKLLADSYAGILHPEDLAGTSEALERMQETGQPTRFENRVQTSAGEWKPLDWTVSPEPDGKNFIAVGRDLTAAKQREVELVHAQEALRQSQKMEAMGQLTGGVAHDFNNLLTPIIGSLDMLQRREIGGEREQRLIGGALESADRAKTLVQRLLAFARRQPLRPTAIDVAALLEGMGELVASTTGPQISIAIHVSDDLIPAVADPNQLEMAILNLSVNARDAMPDGGTLTLAAQAEHVGQEHRSNLPPGDYIRLSVADTGTGMDAATRKRAVEPFFSTKGIGKGTGLGLSMVHGLASQLGGAMHIASEPGFGTKIELWLPVSAEPAGPVASAQAECPVAQGAGTVLLVDDEETVRTSTADMLADLGYQVFEAATAAEALALLESGLRVDLLLTDHLMPGMTGTDLAREARDRWPGCPVLLISGFAEADGVAPDLPRLTKPFRQAELAAALQDLG